MKKKFLTALTAVFVLGLAMAVYAFNQTNNSDKTAASCCSKTESCPLKSHNASKTHSTTVSCCDREDCCCKTGASCPLKNKQAQSSEMKDVSETSGESCCNGAGCCKHKS